MPDVDTDILMDVIRESLMADKAEDITIIDIIGRASIMPLRRCGRRSWMMILITEPDVTDRRYW
ncbi:MAG: hypothetical protein AAYR33_00260 [Acetobacteraceae bacterium]